MLPMIRAELFMSLTAAAWILALFNALGVFFSPIVGSMADWLEHRRAVLIGMGLLCVGSFAGSFAASGSWLLAARLTEGAGYLITVVSAPALLIKVASEQNIKRVFGLWGSFMPLGGSIMMALSPFIAERLGWRGLWRANAFILAAYAILFAWSTRRLSSPERVPFSIRLITGNIVEVIKSGVPLLFALSFMSYAMMFLAFIGFLPTIFIEDAGLEPAAAAMLSALVLAMNIPGNLAGGFLLSRGVPRWRLIFIAIVTMPLASVGVYTGSLPLAVRFISALIFLISFLIHNI